MVDTVWEFTRDFIYREFTIYELTLAALARLRPEWQTPSVSCPPMTSFNNGCLTDTCTPWLSLTSRGGHGD